MWQNVYYLFNKGLGDVGTIAYSPSRFILKGQVILVDYICALDESTSGQAIGPNILRHGPYSRKPEAQKWFRSSFNSNKQSSTVTVTSLFLEVGENLAFV